MTTDVHRLFFALLPAESTRQAISRVAKRETKALSSRLVPPACYHLTLAFLGSQPSDKLQTIIAIAENLDPPMGTLVLDRIGYYPRARVLWLGSHAQPQNLYELTQKLGHKLDALGIKRPNHKAQWEAHLTVARQVVIPYAFKTRTLDSIEWSYYGWHLMESEVGHSGVRYCSIAKWPKDSAVK